MTRRVTRHVVAAVGSSDPSDRGFLAGRTLQRYAAVVRVLTTALALLALAAPTAGADEPPPLPWWTAPPASQAERGIPSPRVPPGEKRAESVGAPNAGSLKRGVRLPASGPGYRRYDRDSHYGTDATVAAIRYVAARYAETYPGSAPLVVGDISAKGGGKLRPHGSHRTGRDVDIGYPARGNRAMTRFDRGASVDTIDLEKSWFVLEALILGGDVQYVFVDTSLLVPLAAEARRAGWSEADVDRIFLLPGDGSKRGAIRHARGHLSHFHVRFDCPAGDEDCTSY